METLFQVTMYLSRVRILRAPNANKFHQAYLRLLEQEKLEWVEEDRNLLCCTYEAIAQDPSILSIAYPVDSISGMKNPEMDVRYALLGCGPDFTYEVWLPKIGEASYRELALAIRLAWAVPEKSNQQLEEAFQQKRPLWLPRRARYAVQRYFSYFDFPTPGELPLELESQLQQLHLWELSVEHAGFLNALSAFNALCKLEGIE